MHLVCIYAGDCGGRGGIQEWLVEHAARDSAQVRESERSKTANFLPSRVVVAYNPLPMLSVQSVFLEGCE